MDSLNEEPMQGIIIIYYVIYNKMRIACNSFKKTSVNVHMEKIEKK